MSGFVSGIEVPQVAHRTAWVDVAKGAAILLVVVGHAWRGINEKGLIDPALFQAIDARIYAFHMPVFFALSGLFIARSLSRMSPAEFTVSRLTRLIWPMVLWTYLFLAVKLAAGTLANDPITARDLLISPVPGYLHLWFLWALFLLHMALLPTRALLTEGRYPFVVLGLLVVGALTLALLPMPEDIRRWIGQACRHAPFFVLGIVLGQTVDLAKAGGVARTFALALFVVVLAFWMELPGLPAVRLGASLLLTLCFLVVLAGFSKKTLFGTVTWLTALGAASMAIYLSHTIFSATLRELLLALGVRDVALHMSLGTLIGVVGPMIVLAAAKRLGMTRLLGF